MSQGGLAVFGVWVGSVGEHMELKRGHGGVLGVQDSGGCACAQGGDLVGGSGHVGVSAKGVGGRGRGAETGVRVRRRPCA